MTRFWLAVLVVVSMSVSACVGGTDPTPDDAIPQAAGFLPEVPAARLPVPDHDFSTAIDPDHGGVPGGHGVRDWHAGSHGLELVGYNPMTGLTNNIPPQAQDSGFTGVGVWGDYACVAYFGGPGGLGIVDISDPSDPVLVGLAVSGMANWECQFTPDGDYLIVSAYRGAAPGNDALPPPAGDAAATGFTVYDVRDKSQPEFLFHDDTGATLESTHTPHLFERDGRVYVLHSYTGHLLEFQPEQQRFVIVSTMEHSGHDAWGGQHPVTGDWLALQSQGCDVVVYDINDMANPVELEHWSATAAREAGWEGSCGDHWRRPIDGTVGGRSYFITVGSEFSGATMPFNVLDWTDPRNVTQVGQWEIPGQPVSPEPNFYTYGGTQYQVWNGYVAAGIMHGGVWVFDVGSPERVAEPATLGYYLPHENPVEHGGQWNKPFAFTPLTWSAAFDARGYVVTADTSSGFYVLAFGATEDGAAIHG